MDTIYNENYAELADARNHANVEAATVKGQATARPWSMVGEEGITGPNTPSIGGATCGEQVEWTEYCRIKDMGGQATCPTTKHVCIAKGQDTIAIVCGSVKGIDASANAELILNAVNAYQGSAVEIVVAPSPPLSPKSAAVAELVEAAARVLQWWDQDNSESADTTYKRIERLRSALEVVKSHSD